MSALTTWFGCPPVVSVVAARNFPGLAGSCATTEAVPFPKFETTMSGLPEPARATATMPEGLLPVVG